MDTVEICAKVMKKRAWYYYVVRVYYPNGEWKSAGGCAQSAKDAEAMIAHVLAQWGITQETIEASDMEITYC